MTIAVDFGRKATKPTNNLKLPAVLILIRPDVLSGLIWVQIVCQIDTGGILERFFEKVDFEKK